MEKSERRSLGGTVSSLRSSKGAVLMNPNGSFAYLCPMKNESVIPIDKTMEPQQVMLPVFGDDELAFYINPQDLPDFVDEVLDTYVTHSRVFLVFMGIQMIVEGMFDCMVYANQGRIEKLVPILLFNQVSPDLQQSAPPGHPPDDSAMLGSQFALLCYILYNRSTRSLEKVIQNPQPFQQFVNYWHHFANIPFLHLLIQYVGVLLQDHFVHLRQVFGTFDFESDAPTTLIYIIMKQQLPRIQDEEQFPGRLHTQSKKIKFGSKDRGIAIATENFHKKTPKHSPLAESDILRQIDTKLEQHKRDIEQRNDMILTIEKGFESVRQELTREKLLGEEKNRLLMDLGQQYQAAQAKLKISSEFKPLPNDKDKERISQLELSLKTLTAREHQLVQNSEQLTAQISDMGQKCRTKEDVGDDSKKLKDAIRKLEEKSYKSQILIEELKKTLDTQSQEKALIKKQMEQLKTEFSSKDSCLSSELSNNANKVKELQKEKQQLQEQQKKLPNLQEQNTKLQEQINQLKQQLGEHTKQKDKELLQFKNNADTQSKNIDQLTLQIEDHKQKIENTSKQINEKITQIEQVTKGKGQQENLLKEQQNEIKQLNQKIEELKTKNQQKPKNLELIQETIALLEKTDKEIQKGLSCTYCNKFIKQPVTIIPCGHSYCFECKKGYQKECSKCGPKLKIEAMYRNELLDDIIEMVKLVEQSIITMKQNTQNN